MERSDVERLIRDHGEPLKDFLGLTDWDIHWRYDRLDNNRTALCDTSLVDYMDATVTLDLLEIDDEIKALDIVAHELFHVLHADFHFYRRMAEAACSSVGDAVVRMEAVAYDHAAERFIRRMEWIWRNHLRPIYLDRHTAT